MCQIDSDMLPFGGVCMCDCYFAIWYGREASRLCDCRREEANVSATGFVNACAACINFPIQHFSPSLSLSLDLSVVVAITTSVCTSHSPLTRRAAHVKYDFRKSTRFRFFRHIWHGERTNQTEIFARAAASRFDRNAKYRENSANRIESFNATILRTPHFSSQLVFSLLQHTNGAKGTLNVRF